MKNWQGTLLTGHNGERFLSRMAEIAHAQSLERTESATGQKFSSYRPWMSHSVKRLSWSHLHQEQAGLTIPTGDRLRILSEAFNEGGALKAIDPSNEDREINFDHPLVIEDFRSKISKYLSEVSGLGEDYRNRLSALVQEVIPLRKITPDLPVRFDGEGMTTQCYRGGVFLTLAQESDRHHCENLVNLIHEIGHQAFNLLLCSDTVVSGDLNTPAYSPVRKTMRPGILAVHALVAVAYMVELMARAPELFLKDSSPKWVRERFLGLTNDLEYGLATVRSLPLTPVGTELINEFYSLHQFSRRELYAFEID